MEAFAAVGGSACRTCSKVGSREHLDYNSRMSEMWRRLSEDQKASYEAKAAELERRRQALMQAPLSAHKNAQQEVLSDSSLPLSVSQVKRLTGARLDVTLSQVSGHPCWSGGLELADHNSALRGSLVKLPDSTAAFDAMREQYDKIFGYDASIVPNSPAPPTFSRPCATTDAGTCCQDTHYQDVASLVAQFDAGLQRSKLGGSCLLVHLEPLVDNVSEQWLVLAGVARRPLCHSVIQLRSHRDALMLSLQNARLQIGSMHRRLRGLLAAFRQSGRDVADLVVKVASPPIVCVVEFLGHCRAHVINKIK